jgi:NADPH:quinone reductase-like Zn-dependent oxidoreductase
MCTRYTIFGEHMDGCYAQLLKVPQENAIPIPETMDFASAASVPLVFLTAWRMMVTRGRLAPSEDVLILGAGAGVGIACIQIAKVAGARVVAAAGSDEKCRRAAELGADLTINYEKEDFVAAVRKFTSKRGVDMVVDYIGKKTWSKSLACLRRGGRLVTCGATTGYDPTEDLRHIFFRQLEIIGSTMGSRKELFEVLRLVFNGRLKAVVDRTLPLSEAAEAHRLVESRQVFGKLVLTP